MRAHETSITQDPRTGAEFFPQFLPLSDLGDPPPIDATQPNDRIRLEFLAAYYHLNLVVAKRITESKDLSSEQSAALQHELEQLVKSRDLLEDRYAPYGVIAEPTVVKGFVVNIAFTFPTESRWFLEQRSKQAWQARLTFERPEGAVEHPAAPGS